MKNNIIKITLIVCLVASTSTVFSQPPPPPPPPCWPPPCSVPLNSASWLLIAAGFAYGAYAFYKKSVNSKSVV